MRPNNTSYIVHLDACNQKCLFCMKSSHLLGRKPDYRAICSIIKKAKNERYKCVDFFGGEPTVFYYLKQVMQLADKLNLDITLATNAVKFSNDNYAKKIFSGVDIKGIRTSLHGYRSKEHDRITQCKGSFNKTIKGIKNILRYNSKLSVNIVITKLNYKDLKKMAEYIYGLGVKGIKISGLVSQGGIVNHRWLRVDFKDYKSELIEALRLSKKLGFYCIEAEKIPGLKNDLKKIPFVKFIE